MALVRRELGGRVPLIGFAGSPWTVATYMVEGGGSKTFGQIKRMMYEAPRDLHRLLEVLAKATILYLNAQIAAGAQAVMLFDTWGGVLTPAQYEEFSLRYMAEVIDALTRKADGRRVPNIVFTKGGGAWVKKIAAIGCDAVGVDWTTDLAAARQAVDGRVALQGNLDPAALFATPEILRAETLRVLASYGDGAGHVFNLGHGITPDVDPERVAVLVETVQRITAAGLTTQHSLSITQFRAGRQGMLVSEPATVGGGGIGVGPAKRGGMIAPGGHRAMIQQRVLALSS